MKNLIDLQKRIINGRFLILALYIISLTFLQSCSKENLTPTASNSTMSSDKRQLTLNADKLPVATNGNARYADVSGCLHKK